MDPNKIHIDELVRQRLSGGEEPQRPGAWFNMRELLDKQLPTRPVGGMVWGRAARWTTALVFLTLVAGGYGAMELRYQDVAGTGGNSTPLADVSDTASGRRAVRESHSKKALPPAGNQESGSYSGHLATGRPVNTGASNPSSPDHSASGAETGATHAGIARPGAAVDALIETLPASASRDAGTRQTTRQPRPAASGGLVSSKPFAPAPASTANAQPSANASLSASDRSAIQRSEARSEAVRQPSISRNASARENRNQSVSTLPVASASVRNRNERSSRAAQDRNGRPTTRRSALPDSTRPQVQRDTVRQIRIAHRYLTTPGTRGGHYVTDTIAYEPVVLERPLPGNRLGGQPTSQQVAQVDPARARRKLFARKSSAGSTQQSDPVVAAATPKPAYAAPVLAAAPAAAPKTSVSEELVPLSSYRVSSRTNTTLKYTAYEQLQDVMRKARFTMAQMKLYTGVTGGFNTTVGGTSLGGFQVGLFGLLTLNEHWSIGSEGKFVQRFNRGTELQDPYFQNRSTNVDRISGSNGEEYMVYRVTHDSFANKYKLSTLESVEFPLYLRYTVGRFHGFAGANLAYGLRVKNVDSTWKLESRESHRLDTVLANTLYTTPANTSASVGLADFGSRFGIGYTAGVGFQATPSVLVDVRMTQLVWDNRSGNAGGLRVSQTFYRVPSLQLSIGYRFSQRGSRH